MKVETSRRGGFTLVELMIVVAIVGLLAAIAIPNFVHAREASQRNKCIAGLRAIDSAKHQWALEEGKGNNDQPLVEDLTPYMLRNKFPECPLGVMSDIQDMANVPTCDPYAADGHELGF